VELSAKKLSNMKTWFTSDQHFGHANIIKHCKRPYADVHEMNGAITNNWNNLVSDEDTISTWID